MTTAETKKMISAYYEDADAPAFFTSLSRTPPENFFSSEKVEFDIVRSGRQIAIAVTDLNTGYRTNSTDIFTNKEFTPPVFKESFPIKAADLIKRIPGENPYMQPEFQKGATIRAMRGFKLIEEKIKRSIELQWAQIFTTGTVTLVDANGNSVYTIDFKPKATHLPDATLAWSNANATIVTDLSSLCAVVKKDGKGLIGDTFSGFFGDTSFEQALNNSDFAARFDKRRMDLGSIQPWVLRGAGSQYRGTIDLGNFKMDLFTVEETYEDPQTSADTQYLPGDKVIVMLPNSRFDMVFGACPKFIPIDQRLLPFLPGRASSTAQNMDMFWNAWTPPDGEQMLGGVRARPLGIPTAIDRFGCLDTNP